MPAVLVDADGTLWGEGAAQIAARRVAEYVASELGADPGEVYREICRTHLDAFRGHAFGRALDWRRVVELAVHRLCGGNCPALEARAAAKHEEWLPWAARRVEPLPGAREALKALRAAGYRIVVVSNGLPKYVVPPLRATGLSRLVDAVVTPASVRAVWAPPVKPWRPIFVEALRAAGRRGPVSMVGNHPLLDCVGALRAGAEECLLVDPSGRVDPERFEGLLDLAADLDREDYVLADGSVAESAREILLSRRGRIVPAGTWEAAAERLLRGRGS